MSSEVRLVRVSVGEVGVKPGKVSMMSSDNLATITAANYLENTFNSPAKVIGLSPSDIVECLYSYNKATGTGTLGIFQPSIVSGIITLVQWVNSADILLPVVSGDFANFNGTTGQIKDAGFSPTNAAKTKVVMANGTVVSGNLAKFADTAGTVADQGVAFKSVAGAAAAGGAAAQSFTDAFCTSGSCVVGNWNTQANAASVLKIVPGNGSFVVTSSADAGVGTFNYIITK